MEMIQIKLNALDDVKDFVNAAMNCDFDIDIFYNRIVVDAKSFLGIMSLDLSKVLNVSYMGHNDAFEGTLQKYAVSKA